MTLRIAAFALLCGTTGCGLWTMTSDEPGSNPEPVGGDGTDGADGTNGADGTDGTDGTSGDDGGTTDTGGTTDPIDNDRDGVPQGEDCDDDDPDRFPGNPERCDGVDNDCSGAPEVDGDGVCGFWTLDAATSTWAAYPMEPVASVHAPTGAIEVAFSVGRNRAWVLTANTFHVLSLDSMEWIDSGDRDRLFPEASGERLTLAQKAPASWDAQEGAGTITLQFDFSALAYSWDPATSAFTLILDTELGADWQADLAPPAASVQAGWLGHDGDFGWTYPTSPRDTCDRGGDALGPYFGVLTTDGRLHVYDAGYCFAFAASMPAANFPIFNYAGAPDPTALGATAWTGAGIIAFVD